MCFTTKHCYKYDLQCLINFLKPIEWHVHPNEDDIHEWDNISAQFIESEYSDRIKSDFEYARKYIENHNIKGTVFFNDMLYGIRESFNIYSFDEISALLIGRKISLIPASIKF